MLLLGWLLCALAVALLVGRRLRRVQPPQLNSVPHSVTGPYLGGSVRAALQIAPDRDTLYREAGELAAVGAFEAAADLVIAASTMKEE